MSVYHMESKSETTHRTFCVSCGDELWDTLYNTGLVERILLS